MIFYLIHFFNSFFQLIFLTHCFEQLHVEQAERLIAESDEILRLQLLRGG